MKTIKKLFIISFISIVAFACSSDDNDDSSTTEENQAKIIGTWKFQSSTTDGVTDTDNDPCLTLLTITFTSSQMTTLDVYGDNCAMSETYVNGYSINGDDISVNDEGDIYTSEIITLNNTTLTIEDSEDNIVYTETYIKQQLVVSCDS